MCESCQRVVPSSPSVNSAMVSPLFLLPLLSFVAQRASSMLEIGQIGGKRIVVARTLAPAYRPWVTMQTLWKNSSEHNIQRIQKKFNIVAHNSQSKSFASVIPPATAPGIWDFTYLPALRNFISKYGHLVLVKGDALLRCRNLTPVKMDSGVFSLLKLSNCMVGVRHLIGRLIGRRT